MRSILSGHQVEAPVWNELPRQVDIFQIRLILAGISGPITESVLSDARLAEHNSSKRVASREYLSMMWTGVGYSPAFDGLEPLA